jgi:alpha/beta superfamily hydrolase
VSSPWHEQAVTIPLAAQGLVLEAVWQAGDHKGAVIAPPHPEYGGSLDSPVVNEIAYGLHREGYASLRFNWRGVGASQGRLSGDVDAAMEDYAAALGHLERSRRATPASGSWSSSRRPLQWFATFRSRISAGPST